MAHQNEISELIPIAQRDAWNLKHPIKMHLYNHWIVFLTFELLGENDNHDHIRKLAHVIKLTPQRVEEIIEELKRKNILTLVFKQISSELLNFEIEIPENIPQFESKIIQKLILKDIHQRTKNSQILQHGDICKKNLFESIFPDEQNVIVIQKPLVDRFESRIVSHPLFFQQQKELDDLDIEHRISKQPVDILFNNLNLINWWRYFLDKNLLANEKSRSWIFFLASKIQNKSKNQGTFVLNLAYETYHISPLSKFRIGEFQQRLTTLMSDSNRMSSDCGLLENILINAIKKGQKWKYIYQRLSLEKYWETNNLHQKYLKYYHWITFLCSQMNSISLSKKSMISSLIIFRNRWSIYQILPKLKNNQLFQKKLADILEKGDEAIHNIFHWEQSCLIAAIKYQLGLKEFVQLLDRNESQLCNYRSWINFLLRSYKDNNKIQTIDKIMHTLKKPSQLSQQLEEKFKTKLQLYLSDPSKYLVTDDIELIILTGLKQQTPYKNMKKQIIRVYKKQKLFPQMSFSAPPTDQKESELSKSVISILRRKPTKKEQAT